MTLDEYYDLVNRALEVANNWLSEQWEEGDELIELVGADAVRYQVLDDRVSVVSQTRYSKGSEYL